MIPATVVYLTFVILSCLPSVGKNVINVPESRDSTYGVRARLAACLSTPQRCAKRPPKLPVAEQELEVVGSLTIGPTYDVRVQDRCAFVTHNAGVAIIDVHDAANPTRVAEIPTTGPAVGVEIVSGIAYVVSYGGDLLLSDVEVCREPRPLGTYRGLAGGNRVLVDLPYAYVSQDEGGLAVFDVRNLSAPRLIAQLDHGGAGKGLAKRGDNVYVAVRGRGLVVVDVADPSHPVDLGTVSNTGCARSLGAQGNHLYMGCHTGRKAVFDISDATSPRELYAFDDSGEAYGLSASDDLLVVADYLRGPQVWNIHNPALPQLLVQADGFEAHSAYYDGSYVYVADVAGLFILELDQGHIENTG